MAVDVNQQKAMAAVELGFAGIDSLPGVEDGTAYIDALTGDFPPLAEMQASLGAYADGINAIRDDAAREAQRTGFRDALLRLSGADEARLSEAVEVAGMTGDAVLLRAARVAAERQGLSGLVEQSVFRSGGSEYEQSAYAERLALPSGENLGIVSSAFAPERPSQTEIIPSDATRQAAESAARTRRGGAVRHG